MSSIFSCGNSAPIYAFGRARRPLISMTSVRRDDGAQRNVVLGHGDFFVDDLQRMNGRDDRRFGSDFPSSVSSANSRSE